MKVVIECNPDINEQEKVTFEYFKQKCKEALHNFKITIEGTGYAYEQKEEKKE